MKKLTVLLLCFLLLCTYSVPVFALETDDRGAVINATVPDTHKVTVTADGAMVYYGQISGTEFDVPRLSSPTFFIKPFSGKIIKSVIVNGKDATARVKNQTIVFEAIYEDKEIVIVTEAVPYTPPPTHKVVISSDSGASVTFDGQSGTNFTVSNASKPTVVINVESGKLIKSVIVNGKDVTDKVQDGRLVLDEVRNDTVIKVITENIPVTTTAPVTTAPVTTAPVTTAPVTTVPVTTAPVTTVPVTTAPVTTELDPKPEDPAEPKNYVLTVTAEDAAVFYEGINREDFNVSDESETKVLIRAESGKVIKAVIVDGEDMTYLLHGGYLNLGHISKDRNIVVVTEDEPTILEERYTVKGRVTLNGKPLANVELELRSTLKTTTTDENGYFSFEEVEPGKHSLTALGEDKVIGYLSFELQKDSKSDVTLQEDGTYTVSIDEKGAGVELELVLDEERAIITPAEANTIGTEEPAEGSFPWLLLIVIVFCIVCVLAIIIYRKKKSK